MLHSSRFRQKYLKDESPHVHRMFYLPSLYFRLITMISLCSKSFCTPSIHHLYTWKLLSAVHRLTGSPHLWVEPWRDISWNFQNVQLEAVQVVWRTLCRLFALHSIDDLVFKIVSESKAEKCPSPLGAMCLSNLSSEESFKKCDWCHVVELLCRLSLGLAHV